MLIAFIGMKAFGLTANLMSLGAVDFGLIVDGAVVMIENFISRMNAPTSIAENTKASRLSTIRSAALEVAKPIVFGIVIIIAVYLPLFGLEGLESRMFRPMALTVCCALIGALFLTLLLVPALGSLVLRPHKHGLHEKVMLAMQAFYRRVLQVVMQWRVLTVGLSLLAVAVTLVSMSRLGTEFMPRLDEGQFLIETRRLPSVSLTQAVEISGMVEKALLEFPEVKNVVTKLGRPDIATDTMGIYQGDVYVLLKPIAEWKTADNRDDLIKAITKKLNGVPGVVFNFTQPLEMRMDEVISGVRADVAVKLFGDDFDQLQQNAERIQKVLERVPGAADVQVEALGGAGELQFEIKRDEMARYGVHVTDIKQVIEAAMGGQIATAVIDGRRQIDVVVKVPEARRRDNQSILALLLPTPNGERVTLGQVATIKNAEGPEVISREDAQRRLVIQSNVRGRDIGSFVAEAQKKIEQEVKLPTGYYLTWGGEFENQQRAMKRLYIVVPIAILLIFLLLYSTFNSVKYATLIIANLPFALVGGVAALWLRHLNLSLSASVGFIALFGVAVLNGVVMVSYINQLREEGKSLHTAVLDGASSRLRPVLMTALVASLGFIPMARSTAPGAEVQRPLATVVIGGLITSTLLTLFVLPTLYEWISHAEARTK